MLIDIVGDRLAYAIADLDCARVVHATPDTSVVTVRSSLRDAGVHAARLIGSGQCKDLLGFEVTEENGGSGACPAGYSGCDGVLMSDSHSGSATVSALPSMSASGIEVTGRHVTSIGTEP